MRSVKRHIAKSLSWRVVGTLDTFLLSYLLSDNFAFGLSISGIDFIFKFLLYYFHERIWFNSRFKSPNTRHLLKTLSWRLVGSINTLLLAWLVTGNSLLGIKLGIVEILTKTILYYIHEKQWYKIKQQMHAILNPKQLHDVPMSQLLLKLIKSQYLVVEPSKDLKLP